MGISIKWISTILSSIFILSLSYIFTGCDLGSDPDDKKDELYVKFENSASSEYTITTIELMAMGEAGENVITPSGVWSDDILESGSSIAPGEHKFFTLDIPNRHYSQYRLGVDNGQGTEIMLHLQEEYTPDISAPTITHWGGDDRTVIVTVGDSPYSDLIDVRSWSDWVGID
ncbi:MAG: hypothetical protein JW956_02105 [Calditrichaceae bacterium]|nr:hypothetical protein [Calditrichaceae bacterium]